MKKYLTTAFIFLLSISLLLITGCGKEKDNSDDSWDPGSNNININVPDNSSPIVPETTTNNLKVNIHDITAEAGSEIDYLAAIESAENLDLDKAMVYVNSAEVDRYTPGTYKVYYSFDYLGLSVKDEITVTITPKTVVDADVESSYATSDSTGTQGDGETQDPATSSSGSDSSGSGASDSGASDSGSESELGNSDSDGTQTASENNTNSANPFNEQPVATTIAPMEADPEDATFVLSNGDTVTIKCTATRYIVETFTEESYSTEGSYNYRTSILKVLMNTGEVQVIETVVVQVTSIPTETA